LVYTRQKWMLDTNTTPVLLLVGMVKSEDQINIG